MCSWLKPREFHLPSRFFVKILPEYIADNLYLTPLSSTRIFVIIFKVLAEFVPLWAPEQTKYCIPIGWCRKQGKSTIITDHRLHTCLPTWCHLCDFHTPAAVLWKISPLIWTQRYSKACSPEKAVVDQIQAWGGLPGTEQCIVLALSSRTATLATVSCLPILEIYEECIRAFERYPQV